MYTYIPTMYTYIPTIYVYCKCCKVQMLEVSNGYKIFSCERGRERGGGGRVTKDLKLLF